MSRIIYTYSDTTPFVRRRLASSFNIGYKLDHTLQFDEPHYARLLWACATTRNLEALPEPVVILASFVQDQECKGDKYPYLGCSAISGPQPWVALATPNCIPQSGQYTVFTPHRSPIPANTHYTIIIEIAPKSIAYGASGSA